MRVIVNDISAGRGMEKIGKKVSYQLFR